MKVRWVVPALLGAVLFFWFNPVSMAVSTRRIKEVRNKDVLSSEHLRAINDFIADAVKELVRTKDFSSVAAVRNTITENAGSTRPSEAQYEAQFFESANKYISEALKKARQDGAFMVEVNLLILIDRLLATEPEDLRLVEVALGSTPDDNAVVRYLAVSAVINPAIVKRLNPKLAGRITGQFMNIVDSSTPETIGLMARFAAESGIPQGEQLLLRIADMRIKKYADWTVEYEPLDYIILRPLCNKISSGQTDRSGLAQRFAQLYSYAIQRYLKDVRGGDFLSEASRQQAALVLVEVERTCISQLTSTPQAAIKNSIEREDWAGLSRGHDTLMAEQLPGLFPGLKPPLSLPDRPRARVSEQG